MSKPKELMEAADAGLAIAWKALNELQEVSVENEDLLALYEKFKQREDYLSSLLTQLRNLSFRIGAERHHRWATSERYYVYISFRYGKEVEASLHSLGEASGGSWHDLTYAARHWKRMEDYQKKPRPLHKGGPIHYSIMGYSPNTGQIRKVGQAEIDAALGEKTGVIPPEVYETPGPPDPTCGVRRALREERDAGP